MDERRQATIGSDLPSELLLGAFEDNRQMDPAGIRYDELPPEGRERLEALLGTYTGRLRQGYAQIPPGHLVGVMTALSVFVTGSVPL